MKTVDLIFSINVHENVDFLIKQFDNIKDYVELNYVIIINANRYMYGILKEHPLLSTYGIIIINQNYLDKKRFHGSLTHGIYLNMIHALNNYKFEYFVVLSSRNSFYNTLNKFTCKNLSKINKGKHLKDINKNSWHWPSMLQTKLSKFIIEHNLCFSVQAHEGLTFNHSSCKKIKEFLENHKDIKDDLFNWNHCVEEFALQSICINLNKEYYHIGHWSEHNKSSDMKSLPKDKFVFKIIRN